MTVGNIFNNNNEIVAYPLLDFHSVYPKGMIHSISVMADTKLYLHAVSVRNGVVTVSIVSKSTDNKFEPYCKGYWSIADYPIATLYNTMDKPIGWISFGTVPQHNVTYSQLVEISSSCIYTNTSYSTLSNINGKTMPTPTKLDIRVLGDLDIANNTVFNSNHEESSNLVSKNIDEYGPLLTINGAHPAGGYISINMPTNDLFKIVTRHINANVTAIIIDNKKDYDQTDYAEFSCPNSDILIDKLTTNVNLPADLELPLDEFITWYRENEV